MRGKIRLLIALIYISVIALMMTGCGEDKEKTVYTSVSDLEGARVGIATGTTFDKIIEGVWDNYELMYFTTPNDMIAALKSDKIDCFVCDKSWFIYYSSENSDLTYLDEPLAYNDLGLIFAKNDAGATVRDDFNAFLREECDKTLFAELESIWFNADSSVHPVLDYDALPAVNGEINVGTDLADPPFEYYENGRMVGYNIHLLYLFCQARGYGLNIDAMAFDAIAQAVTSGKYDIGCSSYTITPERMESFYFSDVVYNSTPVAVIRRESSAEALGVAAGSSFFDDITESFEKTFIRENRWQMFLSGIDKTLFITVISLAAGTASGFLLYMWFRRGSKLSRIVTWLLSGIITVTPEVLLLLILFYIVFGSVTITGTWVSVAAFSLIMCVNAFETVKSGVDAVDRGQTEAALAIGYSEGRGFFRIVLPQALQYIMPDYRSGIVSLIKSTAIVGYLSVQDLTNVSDIVRSRTYETFFPLIVTAVIYFILAWLLVKLADLLQYLFLPIRRDRKAILKGIDTGEEKK